MKRTYEVHYTVQGTATVSFDDDDYDTVEFDGVALNKFGDLPIDTDELDLDTLEVLDVEEIDGEE